MSVRVEAEVWRACRAFCGRGGCVRARLLRSFSGLFERMVLLFGFSGCDACAAEARSEGLPRFEIKGFYES